jgi:hypothetical protein
MHPFLNSAAVYDMVKDSIESTKGVQILNENTDDELVSICSKNRK